VKRVIIALLATLIAALVPGPADAAKSRAKRPAVVCFKKTVTTKSGRKVRRKVCRARRTAKVTRRAPAAGTPAVPAPAVPTAGVGPGPSPLPGTPVAAPTPAAAAPACVPESSEWLAVTALDVNQKFVLRLSRTCLRAGRTVVQLQNQDAQEHDLWVEGIAPAVAAGEVVASAAPESMEQAEMRLGAGEWRLFCSIPGHGTMSRAVTVVP
jgi:hypothetical protein